MRIIPLVLFVIANASGDSEKSVEAESPRGPDEEYIIKSFKRENVAEVEPRTYPANEDSGVAYALFQEDINLTKAREHQAFPKINGNRPKRQAVRNESVPFLWSSHEVNYNFNKSFSKRGRSAFRKAAKLWAKFTCINITEEPDDEEENDYEYYGEPIEYPEGDEYEYSEEEDESWLIGDLGPGRILVEDRGGCSSSVGWQDLTGGYQSISLGPRCQTIGTAAHELGHALGFWHTHSRYDRDEYITVNWTNFDMVNYKSEFEKKSNESNDNYGLPYDYGSVMHYGSTAGSANRSKPVLVPKDPLYTRTLGSLFISFYDLLMMNMLYNCTDICKNSTSTQCQNGGFAHPRDCSKCICPTGYGGDFCEKRPPDLCGEELNATSNWTQLITANSSGMTQGGEDGYRRCVYWLNAPNGSNIEVRLTKLPENVTADGCRYAGVEIKAREDQGLTGYRFCSKDDVNTTLISNSSTVPVIAYSRRRRNATATVLEHRIAGINNREGKGTVES